MKHFQIRIQMYQPLHHLNDVINFFFYNNLYDTYMLSELTALDIFKSLEKYLVLI
jgi:hypothetical protein